MIQKQKLSHQGLIASVKATAGLQDFRADLTLTKLHVIHIARLDIAKLDNP